MKRFVGVLILTFAIVSFVAWCGIRIVEGVQFDRNCGGFVKRAADANTVELAKTELSRAVQYAKQNNLTQGYTSVLWTTPDEDVGFWYTNLTSALGELERVPENATQLERTNVLMKLRETLLDKTSEGEKITAPEGISIFPNNVGFFWWPIFSVVIGLVGLLLFASSDSY